MNYLTQHWSFDPFLILVGLTVVLHEVGLARLRARSNIEGTRRRRIRASVFYAGLALLVLTVVSPLDYWASSYFWVHMVDHLFLAIVIPVLVVAGAPWIPLMFSLRVDRRRRFIRWCSLAPGSRPLRAFGRFLRSPWFAVIVFNALMVLWHFPAAFDLAERNSAVHIWLMHGGFIVAGVLFWLQLIPSHPMRPKQNPLWQAGAILSTNVLMTVMAMSLSILSSGSWYSVYAHVSGVTFSPFADQQLGAAILWVCGDFWAVPALIVVIRRAVEQEGSLSEVVDRALGRSGRMSVAQFRQAASTPSAAVEGTDT